MRATDIAEQLEALAGCGDDFGPRAYELTEAWSAADAGLEAVEPVLRFMEAREHPLADEVAVAELTDFLAHQSKASG